MAGLKRMGNQIVGFAVFLALVYAVTIPANALIAVGTPGVIAWGGAILLVILVMAGLAIGSRRLRLWRDKPLAQWAKLDSRALALEKKAVQHSASDENLSQAEALYKQALDVAQASSRPLLIATALNNLAGLYWNERRLEDADPLFQRALELREVNAGRDDQATMNSIERLSGLYAELDRWADVERLQRRALETYRRGTTKGPVVAETLNAIAAACRHQNKFDEADGAYSQAFAALTSQKSPEAGQILNDWAYLKKEQGKTDEAEQMYLHAIAIREKDTDYMGLAATLDNLADLQVHAGRASQGAVTSQRWLDQFQKALFLEFGPRGRDHPLYVLALEQHAGRLEGAGNAADAQATREKAATIRAAHPEEAAEYTRIAAATGG